MEKLKVTHQEVTNSKLYTSKNTVTWHDTYSLEH